MYQEIVLSDEDQKELYIHCSREELIDMIIEANKFITFHSTIRDNSIQSPPHFSKTIDDYYWELI